MPACATPRHHEFNRSNPPNSYASPLLNSYVYITTKPSDPDAILESEGIRSSAR